MFRSRCVKAFRRIKQLSAYVRAVIARFDPNLRIAAGVGLCRGVELQATDGGTITLGRNVWVGRDTRIVARGGHVVIGDHTFIGEGSLIAAREQVAIGEGTKIAEYVVIRDQDHRVDPEGAGRFDGFDTTPIEIGDHVWIGAKATVLRGGSVGPASIIGAHALVRSAIPAHSVAVGTPARVIKKTGAGR